MINGFEVSSVCQTIMKIFNLSEDEVDVGGCDDWYDTSAKEGQEYIDVIIDGNLWFFVVDCASKEISLAIYAGLSAKTEKRIFLREYIAEENLERLIELGF